MKKNNSYKNGFTLVETLIAVSIFSVSLLGIMSVLASGIANTNYAKQKITATYLAQEGIEHLRNLRDNDVLFSGGGDWSSFNVSTGPVLFSAFDASFRRTIEKTKINDDELKISSTVEWTQGSGAHRVTFSENLFNWVE